MTIMSQVKAALAPVVNQLWADPELVFDVLWGVYVRSEFSESDGYNVEVYDEYALKGLAITDGQLHDKLPAREIAPTLHINIGRTVGGAVSRRNLLIAIRYEDKPPEASQKDIVQFKGVKYSVVDIQEVMGLFYTVELEASG